MTALDVVKRGTAAAFAALLVLTLASPAGALAGTLTGSASGGDYLSGIDDPGAHRSTAAADWTGRAPRIAGNSSSVQAGTSDASTSGSDAPDYFQIDLVKGEVIERLDPSEGDTYHRQDRFIIALQIGENERQRGGPGSPMTRTYRSNGCAVTYSWLSFDNTTGQSQVVVSISDAGGCEGITLSYAGYELPDGTTGWVSERASEQELRDSTTRRLETGDETTLTVDVLPDEGSPTAPPTSTPAGSAPSTATPAPTATPETTPTSTPEPSPTATPEPTPTATPEPTAAPTSSPEPTPTETPTSTPTETPTSTATPTQTPTGAPDTTLSATVTRVVDGDTLEVRLADGSTDTVRLVGVDTPEIYSENTPDEFEGLPDTQAGADCLRRYGERASAYVTDRLEGEQVTLQFDEKTDRRGFYGRLLTYVVHDGENVNYQLVAGGYGRVYDSPFTQSERFYSAESSAQDQQQRLWSCRDASALTSTPEPTPTATPEPTPTATPEPTPAATPEPTPSPTSTPEPTSTATPEATPTSTPEPTPASTPIPEGDLDLVKLQANAPGDEYENLDREYVEFENAGNAPLDLSGWVVLEGDDNQYVFQDVTLDPDETIRLRTGIGADTSSDLYWGLESPVWNNNGDTLEVRDETGAVVIDYQYD